MEDEDELIRFYNLRIAQLLEVSNTPGYDDIKEEIFEAGIVKGLSRFFKKLPGIGVAVDVFSQDSYSDFYFLTKATFGLSAIKSMPSRPIIPEVLTEVSVGTYVDESIKYISAYRTLGELTISNYHKGSSSGNSQKTLRGFGISGMGGSSYFNNRSSDYSDLAMKYISTQKIILNSKNIEVFTDLNKYKTSNIYKEGE